MALVTVRAAAVRLGIGYSTLKQWIYQGRIRSTQTAGGHHRLTEAEIERFLKHHTSDTQPSGRTTAATGLIIGLDGRNDLRGFVKEIRHVGLITQIRLHIRDQHLTAIVTPDAIKALKLRRGDQAVAIIKPTEVMIAREAEHAGASKNRARRRRR
jgi:molybdopterin-binding protein